MNFDTGFIPKGWKRGDRLTIHPPLPGYQEWRIERDVGFERLPPVNVPMLDPGIQFVTFTKHLYLTVLVWLNWWYTEES